MNQIWYMRSIFGDGSDPALRILHFNAWTFFKRKMVLYDDGFSDGDRPREGLRRRSNSCCGRAENVAYIGPYCEAFSLSLGIPMPRNYAWRNLVGASEDWNELRTVSAI